MVQCMQSVEPRFQVDDQNRPILSELFKWSLGTDDAKLDANKGILLCGPIGIGKSTLMRGLQQFQLFAACHPLLTVPDNRFAIFSAAEIALNYAEKGQTAFDNLPKQIGICIDEIGREPLDSKHYGTSINPIQTLLQLRYDRRHQSMTHGTTNLRPDELAHYYGDYIADRCRELFNVIELTGTTRRH